MGYGRSLPCPRPTTLREPISHRYRRRSSASSQGARTRLAAAAFKEGRFADAKALAAEAVDFDGANVQARFVLGLACFRLGDRKGTLDQEQALLAVDPERATALRKLLGEE